MDFFKFILTIKYFNRLLALVIFSLVISFKYDNYRTKMHFPMFSVVIVIITLPRDTL